MPAFSHIQPSECKKRRHGSWRRCKAEWCQAQAGKHAAQQAAAKGDGFKSGGLAQTGDGSMGEVFVVGGVAFVAAGVFLTAVAKRRQQQL